MVSENITTVLDKTSIIMSTSMMEIKRQRLEPDRFVSETGGVGKRQQGDVTEYPVQGIHSKV